MKNKYRHGKLVTGLTMGLVAVSLVTVGFSAWVIKAQSDLKETGQIGVTVENAKDESVLITLLGNNGVVAGNNSIKLDALPPAQDSDGFILPTEGSEEDLNFGITFKVDIKDLESFKGIYVGGYEAGGVIQGWGTSNYLVSPVPMQTSTTGKDLTTYIPLLDNATVKSVDAAKVTKYISYSGKGTNATLGDVQDDSAITVEITKSGTEYTVVATLNFKWGSHFNGSNPCKKDNDIETARASLNILKQMQSEQAPFNISIKYDAINEAAFQK